LIAWSRRCHESDTRISARNLCWLLPRSLAEVCAVSANRAEDEQNKFQRDFEAVLRQSKQARERKYGQEHISYLNEPLETARRTIWALRQ
jgi:hypothetical protein